MPIHIDFTEPIHNPFFESFPKLDETHSLLPQLFPRNLASLTQADNTGNIQCARAHSILMPTSVNDRAKTNSGSLQTDIERTHPFGAIKLVSRHREEIDAHLLHVHRNLSHPLSSVAVKKDSPFLGHTPDLFDRMDGPNFVVGRHDGDKNRAVGDSFT